MRNLIFSLCLLSSATIAGEYPIIIDPVVNATPPGANVTAGYLSLMNDSDETITITDAYSPTIKTVEIHLSTMVDDVAKMTKQDSVVIEPGKTVHFEHGGYNIMLKELTEPLKENSTVDIILVTSSGDMLIEMPVKKLGSTMHKPNHKGMDSDKGVNMSTIDEHNDMQHDDQDTDNMDNKQVDMDKNNMEDSDEMNSPVKVVH